MAISDDQINYLLDQLSLFGEVRSKRMFGGVGFFHQDIMFAMMGMGKFRLRADETSQGDFEAYGMEPMQIKKGKMPYWEVPESVQADREELAVWAQKAFEVALRNKK